MKPGNVAGQGTQTTSNAPPNRSQATQTTRRTVSFLETRGTQTDEPLAPVLDPVSLLAPALDPDSLLAAWLSDED